MAVTRYALVDGYTRLELGRFALLETAVLAYNRAVATHGWHAYGRYLSVEMVG